MVGTIVCPICSSTLGGNEFLSVGYDAIGSLIVLHLVPNSVPQRTSESTEEYYAAIRSAPHVSVDKTHHICGSAGFTSFSVSAAGTQAVRDAVRPGALHSPAASPG